MAFTPPRLVNRLLQWVLGAEDAETIGGDLEETARLSIEPRAGSRTARRWYTTQALGVACARLAARGHSVDDQQTRTTMNLRQDVFHAMRALRKAPGFTATAVVMLAVGIGATVAMFALVHAVVLKRLPFADPDRLMLVHLLTPPGEGPPGGAGPMIWSYPKYQVFRDQQRAFESSAAFTEWEWNITGSPAPERVRGELVEGTYFRVLGIHPQVGRAFLDEETRAAGSPPLVILSYRIWTERFAADPGALGRSLGLNGTPYTIVGVTPPGFSGLTGGADIWVPVTTLSPGDLAEKWNHSYLVVARRKPDVTASQAEADARASGAVVHQQIGSPGGKTGQPWSATAVALDDERVDPLIRRSIFLMLGAVGVVLLIVCINLGNLTMVRSLSGQRDVAIRLALGASRARILSQLMSESALLAVAGGLGAILVAYLLVSVGAALLPDLRSVLPRGPASGLTRVGIGQLGFDLTTLAFTAFAAGAAAMVFGFVPAWRASRRDLTTTIKLGHGALAHDRRRFSGRQLVIVGEVALALVLLTGGGLLLKSVARLQATELGFVPDAVVSVRMVLPGAQYPSERATQFFEGLLARIAARGDVESVAYGSCAPVQAGCNGTTAGFPDRPTTSAAKPAVGVLWASPAYFETLGIRLVRGRVFTPQDRAGSPKVVVVNESAARAFWPGEDPLGRRISLGQGGFGDGAEVVGVVADVRYFTVDQPPRPDVYLPVLQSRRTWGAIFVKSRADTASVVAAVRSDVRALDPDLPLTDIRTMSDRVKEATWRTRASASLLGAFAALALLLVALGVYGVVSQGVQQRTREIGVRLAVGAARRDILRLIIGRAFVIAAAGLAAGLAITVPATRLMTNLLYEVRAADPWVMGALALVLLAVTMLAAYLPAARATRLDPVTTLRAE